MHWLTSMLAALGHDRNTGEIVTGTYIFWRKLPWWIAAMRAATSNDPDKQGRALKALRAIEPPPRRWPWRRSSEATVEPNEPCD